MARLIVRETGVVVNVSDEKAERLLASGTFTPVGDMPTGVTPAKKAAGRKPPVKRAVTKAEPTATVKN